MSAAPSLVLSKWIVARIEKKNRKSSGLRKHSTNLCSASAYQALMSSHRLGLLLKCRSDRAGLRGGWRSGTVHFP